MRRMFKVATYCRALGLFVLVVSSNPTESRAQQATGKGYLPHLANLMNEAMQVHHTKLWLAGRANNWALAAYELAKIKETIEEVKETIVEIQAASPQWRNVSVGEMLRSIDSNLSSMNDAVKAKDTSKFEATYRGLTANCNACHMNAGQSQINIIVPSATSSGPFADQDFTSDNSRQ